MLSVLLGPGRARQAAPAPALASTGIIALPESAEDARPSVRLTRPADWRRSEQRRLRRSRTVPGALRRAWLARRIDGTTYAGYRGTWARSTAAAARLTGAAGAEQRAVLALARGLAERRELHSSRLGVVFLTLRRNTNFWAAHAPPAPGQRFSFGRDPVVFRYEPGQGLQLHWLGTWGRMSGRARFCLEHRARCPKRALRRELDRVVRLASRRGGYDAYESFYRFGGGAPGWVSGMTQGTAVQALARARRAIDAPRFGSSARRALGAFEQGPPTGVAVRDGDGRHYLMYSFAPGLRILNGDLQAITGLYDAARLTGSRTARRLFLRGDRAARRAVGRYDTGAWSLYSSSGSEASLGYHELVDGFLGNLCARTGHRAYCDPARRFARYVREPTRISLAIPRLRPRRPASVSFTISKRSRVLVAIVGRRGPSLRRVLELDRGRHTVGWTPRLSGTFRVRVLAQGPSGPRATLTRSVRVMAPHRQHRSKRTQGTGRKGFVPVEQGKSPSRPREAPDEPAPPDEPTPTPRASAAGRQHGPRGGRAGRHAPRRRREARGPRRTGRAPLR